MNCHPFEVLLGVLFEDGISAPAHVEASIPEESGEKVDNKKTHLLGTLGSGVGRLCVSSTTTTTTPAMPFSTPKSKCGFCGLEKLIPRGSLQLAA
jgi:hypothetical protein